MVMEKQEGNENGCCFASAFFLNLAYYVFCSTEPRVPVFCHIAKDQNKLVDVM